MRFPGPEPDPPPELAPSRRLISDFRVPPSTMAEADLLLLHPDTVADSDNPGRRAPSSPSSSLSPLPSSSSLSSPRREQEAPAASPSTPQGGRFDPFSPALHLSPSLVPRKQRKRPADSPADSRSPSKQRLQPFSLYHRGRKSPRNASALDVSSHFRTLGLGFVGNDQPLEHFGTVEKGSPSPAEMFLWNPNPSRVLGFVSPDAEKSDAQPLEQFATAEKEGPPAEMPLRNPSPGPGFPGSSLLDAEKASLHMQEEFGMAEKGSPQTSLHLTEEFGMTEKGSPQASLHLPEEFGMAEKGSPQASLLLLEEFGMVKKGPPRLYLPEEFGTAEKGPPLTPPCSSLPSISDSGENDSNNDIGSCRTPPEKIVPSFSSIPSTPDAPRKARSARSPPLRRKPPRRLCFESDEADQPSSSSSLVTSSALAGNRPPSTYTPFRPANRSNQLSRLPR